MIRIPRVGICASFSVVALLAVLPFAAVGGATLHLHWTATGDNGMIANSDSFDLRYSTRPITELNWDAATRVASLKRPDSPGTIESAEVTGLVAGTAYYFSIRSIDKFGNQSALSNIARRLTCSGVCNGYTGNVDGSADGSVDIADITMLQLYLFRPFDPVDICLEAANVDGSPDGVVDVSDLIALIAFVRGEGPLAPCR